MASATCGEKSTVLLCVTGCIAAYKSCELLRLLQKSGYRVKVLMTEHAAKFVGPATFRALTHEKVAIGLFDDPEDPIHHISLAQEADLILVAPATANIIAKMANGIADDLMSTTLLATRAPIMVAPAMNAGMWEAAATQDNIATLRSRGVEILQPDSGYLACGEIAAGRLPDPSTIVEAARYRLEATDELSGQHVLVTAGPTHEPIDSVRYIANRSSGKMGIALARQAHLKGADVTLVLGPTALKAPTGVKVVNVSTAQEMYDATLQAFESSTIAILAAAVADYTPTNPADHKLKKAKEHLEALSLTETKDILATLCSLRDHQTVIGFAAETDNVLEYAKIKLLRKGCDAIIANNVKEPDSGFGTDTNHAFWVGKNEVHDFGTLSKEQLAGSILDKASCYQKSSK